MREIKFKALDKEAKRIYDVISIYWDENGEITSVLVNDDGFVMELLLDDIELMQYTGFKDKNDREIYRGYNVKTPMGIGRVFERLGCWFVESQKELGYFHSDEIEIIPELLK